MNKPFRSSDVVLLRRNRWLIGLAASLLLLSLTVLVAYPLALPFGQLPALVFTALFVGALVWHKNPRPARVCTTIKTNSEGVFLGGELPIPRAEIQHGFFVPRSGGRTWIRLTRRGLKPPIDIEVASEAKGRRLLRSLGLLEALQAVESFKVQSRARAHPWLFPLVFVAPMAVHIADLQGVSAGGNITLYLVLSIVLVTLVTAIPSRLHIGTDGVFITWLGTKRFIGFSEISFAKPLDGRVDLHLKAGGLVRIPVGRQVLIILARINEAMEAYRRGGATADIASLLRRGERPIEDWMTALQSIGAGANATHRTAPVAPETLWRLVEDPGSEPLARAAAAVALGAELDDEGRGRLRVVAGAVAAPKLRVAFEAAANDDQGELRAAMAEVEAEEGAHKQAKRHPPIE